MSRTGRVAGNALIAVLVATSLTACGGSIVERSFDGLPPGSAPTATSTPGQIDLPDPDLGPRVQWSDGGRLLALSLFGSSSCPHKPSELIQVGHAYLEVRLEQTGGPQCTADLKAITYELRIPESLTKAAPVTVRVDGEDFSLPARE